jgi:PHD/YefM family antitoxin component YafN of YafNO toxin-antitoxin module
MGVEQSSMKTTTVRQFRSQFCELLQGKEAVLVTRRGKPAAVVYPLNDPKKLPMEVRRKLYLELSAEIARELDAKGITEDEILDDFEEFKKRRRRR